MAEALAASQLSGMGMASDASAPATLSAVCKFWTDLDLESLRTKLDETGLKIAEYQEEAIRNRKQLAEATREFKRSTGDTPVKGLGPLLKNYQEEIDRLTKRCKNGETAFLDLYQRLYEAPDPAPALALAFETASRVADLEAQNKKLSSELADYKAEAASIRNQDLTIRRLEDKIRTLEASVAEKSLEVDEIRQQAVAEADAARMAQMQEREAELSAMLSEAQASLALMQKLHTASQNQLFAIQSQSEEEQMGRQVELELASAELERAQERLMALEQEKTVLKRQLESDAGVRGAGKGGEGGDGEEGVGGVGLGSGLEESMRQELHTQREVATRLRLEVTSLRRELDEAHSMSEARLEGLRASLHASEQHARALERELAMRPRNQQVEDLKAQIRLLQAVGYNTLSEDDGGDPGGGGGSGGGDGRAAEGGGGGGPGRGGITSGSLEALLIQKNRHLEHQLTMAKLKVVDSKSAADAAAAHVAELQAQLVDKAALISQLEDDLMQSRKSWAPARQASTKSGSQLQLGAGGEGGEGGDGGEGEEDVESSMVRVVCGQRDRLRARCMELEEEVQQLKSALSAAKSQVAAAKADNIALVERLRYVHGFKAQQRGGGGGGGDVEVGLEAEKRYGRLYEEGINPFKEFQGEQRERQKSNLHFADKLMYGFGQLVFGSSSARLGTFAYLVIMHLLVVLSLMRMTHHSSSALLDHHQDMLDAKHDMMATMHVNAAVAVGASPVNQMHDSRLP